MALAPKIISTSIQTHSRFSALWEPNRPRNFIRNVFSYRGNEVYMDLSRLSEDDAYYRQVILDTNIKLDNALSSQSGESPMFVLCSTVEEELVIKVGILMAEGFKKIVSELGSNACLRIEGNLIGTREEISFGNPNTILPEQHFDMRFYADGHKYSELVRFNEDKLISYGRGVDITFDVDISVEWDRSPRPLNLDATEITRSLFEDNTSKDCTLVGADGEVKCHALVLTARSAVFKRMLAPETGMVEATSGRIDFQEMTQDCLKHFVELLYGIEMNSGTINCEMTVRLFEAAEKYDLHCFFETLRKVLMDRGMEWYKPEPDAILELFGFVNQLPAENPLKDHLLKVMNRMTAEIRDCERYKGMTKPELETLMWALYETRG